MPRGLGESDHAAPSQVSAMADSEPLGIRANPTAMHRSGRVHETAFRALERRPPGSAVGSTDHRAPSQPTAKVPRFDLPTAVQAVGLTQDTESRESAIAPCGKGTAVCVQTVPSPTRATAAA